MKRILVLSEEGEDYSPATITDAVGHDQMKSSLTKLINKYNLTTCYPTGGLDNGPIYDLNLAINLLNSTLTEEQKFPGVHAEFTSISGEVEVWEYYSKRFRFDDPKGWRRSDSGVILELMEEVFPVSVGLFINGKDENSLARVGEPTRFSFSWSVSRKGKDVTEAANKELNGMKITGLSKEIMVNESSHKKLDYTFTGSYQGLTEKTTKSITIVHDCYYGPVSEGWKPNVADIKSFNKTYIKNSRYFSWSGIEISNKRLCYAYPAYHGSLTSIKDGNNFEYLNSYTKTNLSIDGINYYVYTSNSTTTVSKYKQTFS